MEPMSKPGGVKTLGIKLPDELHAQFALVAQLDELSLTDAMRRAVELYVAAKQSAPDFAARAAAALEEIEREAAARRGAIQALFGQGAPTAEEPKGTSRRKSGEATSGA
jgi:hypothetical protein